MFEDLTIFIPSRGRAERFHLGTSTWTSLSKRLRKITYIVVPKDEVKIYRHQDSLKDMKDHVIGVKVDGIAAVRAYLIQNCPTRYILMLDDDLIFYRRPTMKKTTLIQCKPKRVEKMIRWMLKIAKEPRMVQIGVSARQGNNTKPTRNKDGDRIGPLITRWDDGRCMNLHFFDCKRLKKVKVKYNRVPVMEDFDITLQILRKGWRNTVLYKYCWNQSASNLKGGCSEYRTPEVQAKAAYLLAKHHPKFVKVKVKKSKSTSESWKNMKERVDVQVAWRKAAEELCKRDYTPMANQSSEALKTWLDSIQERT